MKITQVKIFFLVIGLLILGTITAVIFRNDETSVSSTLYDEFAVCLKDKGAVFYGAFWCSHCQTQKKLFGSSQKLLPYIECSTLDGQSQTKICIDENISSYPTWEFVDGTRLTGEVSLETLAERTSCVLPERNGTIIPIQTGASSEAQ